MYSPENTMHLPGKYLINLNTNSGTTTCYYGNKLFSKKVACFVSLAAILYTRPVDVVVLVFIRTCVRLTNSSSTWYGKEKDGEGLAG